jgi:hypothetical protein
LAVTRVVAHTHHEIPERPALRLDVGDEVGVVGERDPQWPEFVFVKAALGSGWVPARHLSGDSGHVVVEMSYDTTELSTSAGESLEVVREDRDSGWLWCRSETGREGWVPLSTVQEA